MGFIDSLFGKRKYVSIQYDNITQIMLRQWAIDNRLDLTTTYSGEKQSLYDFDFHTTIFFSFSRHFLQNQTIQLDKHKAEVIGKHYLGLNKDIPVLDVYSPAINEIRHHYERKYQMTDEWPEYKAHISISYGKTNPPLDKITLPDFPLYFDKLIIEDAKEF